jgi:hypothetical protein
VQQGALGDALLDDAVNRAVTQIADRAQNEISARLPQVLHDAMPALTAEVSAQLPGLLDGARPKVEEIAQDIFGKIVRGDDWQAQIDTLEAEVKTAKIQGAVALVLAVVATSALTCWLVKRKP